MKIIHLACVGLLVAASAGVCRMSLAQGAGGVSNSRRALGDTVRELNVDGVSLAKVLDYLRNVSNCNMVVNWKVLEGVGVTKDTVITLQVRDLPLRKMLQLVLDQASPNAQLIYGVDSNIITITSQEDADKQLVTKVYDVGELVAVPNNTIQPMPIGMSGMGGGYGGGMGGGYGGGLNGGGFGTGLGSGYGQSSGTGFGVGTLGTGSSLGVGQGSYGNQTGGNYGLNGQQQIDQKTPDQKGQELVDLITSVIRPNIWSANGGPATIKYLNRMLIVTAPISVQEAIGGPVNTSTGSVRFGM